MKVLILSSRINTAVKIALNVNEINEVDLKILLNNNSNYNNLIYILFSFYLFVIKMTINERFFILKLFFSRKIVFFTKIHSEDTLSWINKMKFDIGLHNVNVIYKSKIISLFKYGIINPHIGLLPDYRGRSVMEWSILQDSPTGITTFFIDSGIDTGELLISWNEIEVRKIPNLLKAKKYLFSKTFSMFKIAIQKVISDDFYLENDISKGKRYYQMSSLLSSVVDQILKNSKRNLY